MFAGISAPAIPAPQLDLSHAKLVSVTHQFSRNVLLACDRKCGLGGLPEQYLDLALMRIIEPTSKLRTLELLPRYFNINLLNPEFPH
jgi:hypothetical protein